MPDCIIIIPTSESRHQKQRQICEKEQHNSFSRSFFVVLDTLDHKHGQTNYCFTAVAFLHTFLYLMLDEVFMLARFVCIFACGLDLLRRFWSTKHCWVSWMAQSREKTLSIAFVELMWNFEKWLCWYVTHFVKSSTEEYRACERDRLISQISFHEFLSQCVRRCYNTGDLCNNSAMQRCKLKYRASFGHGYNKIRKEKDKKSISQLEIDEKQLTRKMNRHPLKIC